MHTNFPPSKLLHLSQLAREIQVPSSIQINSRFPSLLSCLPSLMDVQSQDSIFSQQNVVPTYLQVNPQIFFTLASLWGRWNKNSSFSCHSDRDWFFAVCDTLVYGLKVNSFKPSFYQFNFTTNQIFKATVQAKEAFNHHFSSNKMNCYHQQASNFL